MVQPRTFTAHAPIEIVWDWDGSVLRESPPAAAQLLCLTQGEQESLHRASVCQQPPAHRPCSCRMAVLDTSPTLPRPDRKAS